MPEPATPHIKRAAARLGAGLSQVLGRCDGAGFGILTYHRLAPWTSRGPAPTWNVTPRRFRAQLAGLLGLGYRPWPLARLLDCHRDGQLVPPRTFVVTFDDGYENVYLHAWPILRELRVPATVFVATAYLDQDAPFPFDDWAAAGAVNVAAELWRPLTTKQCAAMRASGLVEIGTHTHTHARFRGRPEALYQDLLASLAVLRAGLGLAEVPFAFPFGVTGPDLAAAARRAGVRCSLTTQEVLAHPQGDPFAWGRFGVAQADSAGTLAARLDGWYSLARGAWRRLRRSLSRARGA
jgi:peptidoglycan/xylan/chitin deacetylase (PgdA/CDA1 family)